MVEEGDCVIEEDGDWTATVGAEKEETDVVVDEFGMVEAVTMDVWLEIWGGAETDGLDDGWWDGDGGQQVDDESSNKRDGGLEEPPEVDRFGRRPMKELFLLLHKVHFLFLRDWDSNVNN